MGRPANPDTRRRLPSVDRVLEQPSFRRLEELYGRDRLVGQVRQHLGALRRELERAPEEEDRLEEGLSALPERIEVALEAEAGTPVCRVLNATGIFLHTNLGRAPLPRDLAASLPGALDAYLDLELDRTTGRRSDRNQRIDRLLSSLVGAEAGLAVNNNAAALFLILATLASGREVVLSRGELVEIGGSFRIPDVLAAAGARLVEVGTTNRTRRADYERAIGPETALLLKVHRSNFVQTGFVAEVTAAELVEIGREAGLPVVVDEGSGLLRPHPAPQLADHESFEELLAVGCDLVCGSGDKLLGGPQAGLVAGRRDLVERCRRHPVYRVVRPDRAALTALEAILRRAATGAPLPMDRLWVGAEEHRRRLERLVNRLGEKGAERSTEQGAPPLGTEIVSADAYLGGGAAPERPIPGEVLAIPDNGDLFEALRLGSPPVVGYVADGRLHLDLRTVDPEDDGALADALEAAHRQLHPQPARHDR
jgi:L-seryl-tRNA(Ser) seleniumtransferase